MPSLDEILWRRNERTAQFPTLEFSSLRKEACCPFILPVVSRFRIVAHHFPEGGYNRMALTFELHEHRQCGRFLFCQAECARSSHTAYGTDCKEEEPCTACEYWPIYPCYSTTKPMIDCLMMYTNDFLSGTDDYMYGYLITEGHDARQLKFSPAPNIQGGHAPPQQQYDWLVGCLGITAACTQECEASFSECMIGKQAASNMEVQRAFSQCIQTEFSTLAGCDDGCSPTLPMLENSEVLVADLSHTENFGGSAEGLEAQPDRSICIAGSTQNDDQAASPPPGAENPVETTSAPTGAENGVETTSAPTGAENEVETTSAPTGAENEVETTSPPPNSEEQDTTPLDSMAPVNKFLLVNTIISFVAMVWIVR